MVFDMSSVEMFSNRLQQTAWTQIRLLLQSRSTLFVHTYISQLYVAGDSSSRNLHMCVCTRFKSVNFTADNLCK